MIVHNTSRQAKKSTDEKPFRRWLQRYRICFQLAVLVVIFLSGAFAYRQGALLKLRVALGLSDRHMTFVRHMIYKPSLIWDELIHPSDLETLYIDMKFEDFKKIRSIRDRALQRGVLIDKDKELVPANIRFRDRTIRVKMRLKGELVDHLRSDKWSYRFHVKGDDHLLGMRRFSIQHPGTRKYLMEWGWLENLRLEDILAPRYRFVNVVFNGTSEGIFALEEHFSKELLESQKRREGVVVAFDESLFWQRWAQLGNSPKWYDSVYLSAFENAAIKAIRPSRIRENVILKRERDEAIGQLRAFQEGERSPSEVFDALLLGRFLAISELWQTGHAFHWNNVHFYYNPITSKLEPIGFDGTSYLSDETTLYALSHAWLVKALSDPKVAAAYIQELNRVKQPEYLEQKRALLEKPYEVLRRVLVREFPRVQSMHLWDILKKRQANIRRALEVPEQILAFANLDDQATVPDGNAAWRVEVRNLLSLPVEVIGFQVGSSFIPATEAGRAAEQGNSTPGDRQSIMLPGRYKGNHEPVPFTVFRLPMDADSTRVDMAVALRIQVMTRLPGTPTPHVTSVQQYPQAQSIGHMPSLRTVSQAIARYPFLKRGEESDVLHIQAGIWDIDGDLVLPPGVRIKAGPGTTLRFNQDAVLISRGALDFQGTADSPVALVPQEDNWGGVVVLEARQPSIWEHVLVKNTQGVERGGWILTGGITFYKSPIYLSHSRILGSRAEDGINVIRSLFEFRKCELGNFTSDALDGDFTQGVIRECAFHDIQGDAIDVSGSKVEVRDVSLRNIGDKGVSAGERSEVKMMSVSAVKTGIAVASKDLSHVHVERATIEQARHVGLAAYEKKREFGPASIVAVDVDFIEVPQKVIVQKGSEVTLNGSYVSGTDMDVKALYKLGILGN